ncbi:MAG: 6-carboxytetrahydropterin synthase QueD [Planctomycetota bacterium]
MTCDPHYELSVQEHFAAAHHLRGYDGECARPHGHNWTVEVFVTFSMLNDIGIGIDFRDVKAALRDTLSDLDHTDLNELQEFAQQNPSSENIARYVYHALKDRLDSPGLQFSKVTVSEASGCAVTYSEG